jgi:type VII secretion integral membrane protein EccD
LLASPDAAGPLAPVAWLGAPELLVGSVALLLAGVLSGIGVGTGRPVFVGGVTVGLLGALTALAGFFLTAAGAAAVLLCVLVCGIGVLPLLAIRFGRLPMPPLVLPIHAEEPAAFTGAEPGTEPTGLDGARERPDRGRVFAAVARTEELLTGMVIGYGVLAVGGSLVLVLSGGSAGRLLVAVAAAALCLRSRLFVGVRQRVPLLTAGMTGFAALAVDVLRRADEPALLALTGGALVAAVVAIAAGGTYSRRPPSPYLGRAADAVDALMVISVVPVACAVLGLYARVRGLTG